MKTSFLFQLALILSLFVNISESKSQRNLLQTSNHLGLNVTGPTVVCDYVSNGFLKYEVELSAGDYTYNWRMPQGMMIFAGQGDYKIFADVDWTFTNGWVVVTKTDANGISITDSLYVDVLPATPVFNIASNQVAFDQNINYSVDHVNNTNFIWTAPYGAIITDGQGTADVKIKFSQSFTGGHVTVTAENNCGISATNQFWVDAPQTEGIISDNSFTLKPVTGTTANQFRTLPGDIAFHDNLTTATFRDTIKSGDDYYFEVVLQNFSQSPMESFYLKYYLASNATNFIELLVQGFEPGEARTLPVFIIPTSDLDGTHELIIELNPEKTTPESDYNNNTLTVPFTIKEEAVTSNQMLSIRESNVYNYPNPVTEQTLFNIELGDNFSETETADIVIYNMNGQLVKQLTTSNNGNGIFANVVWNRKDNYNIELPAGVYAYNVIAVDNAGVKQTINSKSNIQIIK